MIAALCLWLLTVFPWPGSPLLAAPLDEDQMMIWEVRLGRETLTDGLIAYLDGDHVMLPLGALGDLLGFALETDPRHGRARGWFISEDRTFDLELGAGTVRAGSFSGSIPAGAVAVADGEVYVRDDLLTRWFPLEIEARPAQLLLVLHARETLPVQLRREREDRRKRSRRRDRHAPEFPLVKADYQPFTWPLLDLHAEYRGREGQMKPWINLQASGDVGKLGVRAHVSHDDGSRLISTARLRAGRQDADGGLLGPLDATRFEGGDLYAPSTPLILRGKVGRGLSVTNAPLHRPERFDTTEITGDAPPGWEVELYANGALLDYTTVGPDGRYLFRDVPLSFGRNVLRTVVYGPQGQTREHQRTIVVGTEMIPRHTLTYRALAIQDDRLLITGERYLADTPDRGKWTRQLELGYGLSRRLSLLGGWTRMPVAGITHDYRSLGLGAALAGTRWRLLGVDDTDGGTALSLLAQGDLGGRSVTLEQLLFDDFLSDANDPARQRTSETNLRVSGAWHWRRNVSYALSLRTISFTNRGIRRQDLASLRLASSWPGLSLTQRWEYWNNVSSLGSNARLSWSQLASSHVGPLLLRGRLRTRLSPETTLEALGLSGDLRPGRNLHCSLRLEHNYLSGETTFGGAINLLRDGYALTLNGHTTSDGDRYLGIALTTSLTQIPETRRLHVQRRRLSSQYGASARVFLDRNGNGRWDGHDDSLPGVGFRGNGTWTGVVTDQRGVAYLPNLPADRPQDIVLDESTLPDPFMRPLRDGLRVSGHPGAHVELEFPVTYTGDVEGTVYLLDRGVKKPLGGIELILTDQTRREVGRTISGYDGYYLFQHLRPGWYEVSIDPEALKKRGLRPTAPLAVMIPAEGGVNSGEDFVLRTAEPLSGVRRAGR